MTSPRCETCPWCVVSETGTGAKFYYCHHADSQHQARADWWCSLHPDAPQPAYDAAMVLVKDGHPGEGWEPVQLAFAPDSTPIILWRRITGYTRGGRDE